MSNNIIWNPLVTVDQVRDKAGQTWNDEISDDNISQILAQVFWVVLSHVASRYDISKFTDDLLVKNESLWLECPTTQTLTSISVELWASILNLKHYWVQKLSEDNNAQKTYDMQMSLLADIRDWQLRLLDNTLNEFPLLPLKPWRSIPNGVVSSFNDTSKIPTGNFFKVDQTR